MDELLGERGGLAMRHHPADHVAAEDVTIGSDILLPYALSIARLKPRLKPPNGPGELRPTGVKNRNDHNTSAVGRQLHRVVRQARLGMLGQTLQLNGLRLP